MNKGFSDKSSEYSNKEEKSKNPKTGLAKILAEKKIHIYFAG